MAKKKSSGALTMEPLNQVHCVVMAGLPVHAVRRLHPQKVTVRMLLSMKEQCMRDLQHSQPGLRN